MFLWTQFPIHCTCVSIPVLWEYGLELSFREEEVPGGRKMNMVTFSRLQGWDKLLLDPIFDSLLSLISVCIL